MDINVPFKQKRKEQMAGVPPCISCLFGARNLGRVLATLPYFAFSVASFFPHSDDAKSLRLVGSSIKAGWRDLRSNWIASFLRIHPVQSVINKQLLRIHSVRSVINNPTQLSGRIFHYIFYIKLIFATCRFTICVGQSELLRNVFLYVFFYTPLC